MVALPPSFSLQAHKHVHPQGGGLTPFILHSDELSSESPPCPTICPPTLPPSLGAEPLKLCAATTSQVPLSPPLPASWTWHDDSSGGRCHRGARRIQPETASATEPSTHRQMVRCSNSLSELITLPPEGRLHSGAVPHFPAKCVFFPQCFLPAPSWVDRGACSWRQERCLLLPPPFFAFGF